MIDISAKSRFNQKLLLPLIQLPLNQAQLQTSNQHIFQLPDISNISCLHHTFIRDNWLLTSLINQTQQLQLIQLLLIQIQIFAFILSVFCVVPKRE